MYFFVSLQQIRCFMLTVEYLNGRRSKILAIGKAVTTLEHVQQMDAQLEASQEMLELIEVQVEILLSQVTGLGDRMVRWENQIQLELDFRRCVKKKWKKSYANLERFGSLVVVLMMVKFRCSIPQSFLRNQLVMWDLRVTVASMCLAFIGAVGAVFGQNLKSGLEESHTAFILATVGSIASAIFVGFAIFNVISFKQSSLISF